MPLKTHMDEQPELNLTPMIDIVFLLIIFFHGQYQGLGNGTKDCPGCSPYF